VSIDPVSIDEVLRVAVERGDVPNVVAIAADRDGVIYRGAAGARSTDSDDPISPDTHFRIMSMTKMVATVAALQLVEKGRLDLDAPVDSYCPEFADVQVLEGFDGDTPRLRAPASRATVKQLVTHTTGLGYWFCDKDLMKWEAVTSTPNVLSGTNVVFTAPLLADPGTTYVYGINTDWLARSWRPRAVSRWTSRSRTASPGRSAWTRPPSRSPRRGRTAGSRRCRRRSTAPGSTAASS
jgi:CubicO group peptidase (beta-lactamase class C family)